MKMVYMWIFAFLPLCLSQTTDENCMTLIPNFVSLTSGEKCIQ